MSGNHTNDRLEVLKAKCEQEIKETEEKLRTLKAKLNTLVSLAQESDKIVNPSFDSARYASTGYTEAILDAVNSLWQARKSPCSAPEIKDYLLANGFKAGVSFDISVYTVLKRLLEQGKIETVINRHPHSGLPRLSIKKRYKPK